MCSIVIFILFYSGYFTNHSLRASAATRLFNEGVDEQLICEQTGHRSSAVRAYKRTSLDQKEKVSDIVNGNVEIKGTLYIFVLFIYIFLSNNNFTVDVAY